MSVILLGDIERSDDFDEDLFEILFAIAISEFGERAFGKELAGLDDADHIAEFFDFGHDVGGENDGFAALATLANKFDDGSSGHHVEAAGGLVENHDLWIVNERAGDGSLLLHAGGEFVAAAVAKRIHVQAGEDIIDTFFQSGLVDAIEAAKVFDHFLGREAGIKRGGRGEEANIGADLFRVVDDVVAANRGGAAGGFEDGGEHAKSGGFTSAVGPKQAVDLAWFAGEGDIVHGTDLAALFVMKDLGETARFNHGASSGYKTGW